MWGIRDPTSSSILLKALRVEGKSTKEKKGGTQSKSDLSGTAWLRTVAIFKGANKQTCDGARSLFRVLEGSCSHGFLLTRLYFHGWFFFPPQRGLKSSSSHPRRLSSS